MRGLFREDVKMFEIICTNAQNAPSLSWYGKSGCGRSLDWGMRISGDASVGVGVCGDWDWEEMSSGSELRVKAGSKCLSSVDLNIAIISKQFTSCMH